MQADDLLRRRRPAPARASRRTAGSWPAACSRSASERACTCRSSASSISVLSNRVPRLWGASLGWSGSTIAAPRTASSPAPASTGQMLTLAPPRSSGETKRPADTRITMWVEISESAQRRGPVEARRDVDRVVHAGAHEHAAVGVSALGAQRQRPPSNCTVPRSPIVDRPELDPPLGAPRAGRPTGTGSAGWRSGARPAQARPGTRAGRGQRPPRTRPRRSADRRSRTASGSRSWLLRGCTGTARSPRTAAHRPAPAATQSAPSPASSSSSAMLTSKLGWPRAARRRLRRSSVSSESRIQPPPG